MTDEMDELLDAALKRYVAQPAPFGMDRRVLERLHPAQSWWTSWLPAMAVLAAVCLVLVLPRKAVAPKAPSHPDGPREASATVTPVTRLIVRGGKRHSPRPELPRPEQLTEGERALLRFLVTDPEGARQVLGNSLIALNRPATIEALRIEPLGTTVTKTQVPEIQTPEIQIKEMNQ